VASIRFVTILTLPKGSGSFATVRAVANALIELIRALTMHRKVAIRQLLTNVFARSNVTQRRL